MLKKHFFAVIFFLMIFCALFAEDVYFKTVKNTPVWQGAFYTNDRILFEIPQDTIVIGDLGVIIDPDYNRDQTPFHGFVWNDKKYITYIESLVPAETEDLFPKELISDTVSTGKKQLIFGYYAQALAQGNRDVIRNQDTLFWQWFDKQPRDFYDNDKEWWYFLYTIKYNFLIFQTTLYLLNSPYYSFDFFVKNIRKNGNIYHVTAKMYQPPYSYMNSDPTYPPWANSPIAKIPVPSQREFFDFIIVPDGDYLDVYVDNYDTHFATFVYADNQFLQELETLIRTGTCNNLTRIVWPRRADGSMDYPPPADMSGFSADRRTTDRLRLRDNPATASLIVTTLESGTEVQVLETGPSAVIDGITASWVRVLSANGYAGWCFGGYLEEIAKPVASGNAEPPNGVGAVPVEEPQGGAVQDSAKTSAMPFGAWLAIIGGAVVIAGGAVVFVVKRKK
jgi:hypothetical protein